MTLAHWTSRQAPIVLLLACCSTIAFADPVDDGLAWIESDQNVDGSWGGSLEMTVTGTVLETLATLDPCTDAVSDGASWLSDEIAPNQEFLARQAIALAGAPGFEASARTLAELLLASRNPAEPNAALPNWPEGGWGISPGFETDSLTTALAMLALDRNGFNGGFEVSNGAVAGGATAIHAWEIPGGATKVRTLITVGGSEIRLCMTEGAPPPFCNPYFPLPPGGPFQIVFPDSGLPFTPGTNFVVIESPSPPALPATYTMTASYETPTFDTRTLAEPLAYLRQAQNVDGGWGLKRGQTSELYTTLHVLLALLRYSPYDFATEIAAGIAYVKTQQLGDGSFGFGGLPVPYVTALAGLDLLRSETSPFSTETEDAITALLALQELNGSWADEAYDTALAMLALWVHELPPIADAGPDLTIVDSDENCVEDVTLSGSGASPDGVIVSYEWTENCVVIASGSSPTVSLSVGTHDVVLTVTADDGQVARDNVTVVVEGFGASGGGDPDACSDLDSDGILDDGDGNGEPGDNPCPDGVTTGCDDNCVATPNPGQADADADRHGDACDCDSGNASVWERPGQVELLFSSSTELIWDIPDPGGYVTLVYDLVRSADPSNFQTSVDCVESDEEDTTAILGAPAAGTVDHYLVRAENACPGPGSLGTDSTGTERPGTPCP